MFQSYPVQHASHMWPQAFEIWLVKTEMYCENILVQKKKKKKRKGKISNNFYTDILKE